MYKPTRTIRPSPAIFLLPIFIAIGVLSLPKQQISLAENRDRLVSVSPITTTVSTTDVAVVAQPAVSTTTEQVLGLKIDAINLNIPLGKTTLGSNRELLVPADASKAAWYKSGPKLGAPGTALITGHMDSPAGPGVFYNLNKLKTGDMIQAKSPDGEVLNYKVDKLASYRQDSTFPWNLVYSTTGDSSIRIITCDGTYNPQTARYSHNLVVYASLVN